MSGPSLWEVPAEQEEKLVDEMPLKDMPIDKLPTEDIPTEEIPKASRTAAESIDANRLSRDAAARKAQETPIDQNPSHKLPAVREGLRAWIELDPAALKHNVDFLRSMLPKNCRLMPAVKADAYGHGGVAISRLLNQMGVDAFCVACLAEGIALREAGIQGEILILGYTPPEDFRLLYLHQLSQSVVDYEYAKHLNGYGKKLHVHLAD